jgi:dolichyl-phosphate-mannose--protein O-mannosyl transferase
VLTYGSAVRLRHVQSAHHLHSHGINYGSGSGQQSVTAVQQDDDSGSLWQLRERYGADGIAAGSPLHCGDTVRLQHVSTRRWLHSHLHASPLTNRQEVSGYGEGSHSDTGDDWRLECSGGLSAGAELPLSSASSAASFSLQHVDTGKRLYSRRMDEFTQHNCRGCPIIGQLEVSAASVQQHDPAAQFSVRPSGIFFPRKQQQTAA